MKTVMTLLFLICLTCTSAVTDKENEFLETFFDDKNVESYFNEIDRLIGIADTRRFASVKSLVDSNDLPSVTTSNGIRIKFSITEVENEVGLNLSLSRDPYLPVVFGNTLVRLFEMRSGLPKSDQGFISPNQVFHSLWIYKTADYNELAERMIEKRNIPLNNVERKKLIADAYLKANSHLAPPSEPVAGGDATR